MVGRGTLSICEGLEKVFHLSTIQTTYLFSVLDKIFTKKKVIIALRLKLKGLGTLWYLRLLNVEPLLIAVDTLVFCLKNTCRFIVQRFYFFHNVR